jgi:hypothetical protein
MTGKRAPTGEFERIEKSTPKEAYEAVLRSAPNPKRPRLPTEVEERLAPLESRSAASYAGGEAACARADALIERLQDDDEGVVAADLELDGSLAYALDEASKLAKKTSD